MTKTPKQHLKEAKEKLRSRLQGTTPMSSLKGGATRYYVQAVEAAIETARHQLEQLAARFRVEILLPICRRRRLTFISGMGRTVFYDIARPDLSYGSSAEALDADFGDLADAFVALNAPGIGQNDCLGYYVQDISEQYLIDEIAAPEEELKSDLKKLRLAEEAFVKSEDNVRKIRESVYLSTLKLSDVLGTTIDEAFDMHARLSTSEDL